MPKSKQTQHKFEKIGDYADYCTKELAKRLAKPSPFMELMIPAGGNYATLKVPKRTSKQEQIYRRRARSYQKAKERSPLYGIDRKIACPDCGLMTDKLSLWIGCHGSDGWCCDECFGNRTMEE